ncbi:MAG: diguanylate cyclase, partial [Lapillicoccus sp.]
MAARVGSRVGGRVAVLSRLASVGLVVILVLISTFGLWSSRVSADAAQAASLANTLTGHYSDASFAVAAEESLERKYRLEPSPGVRANYDAATAQLLDALALVARDGGPGDRALAEQVRATHATYLAAINRMFRAVDAGDTATVLKIDSGEVDPLFGSIAQTVGVAAEAHRAQELVAMARQQAVQGLEARLSPTVFSLGLLLAALLSWFTRVYRRLLDGERRRAQYDSMHDHLTGLPNRALLADRLGQALRVARRDGVAVGLLLLDLDRFKEVNDTFGHRYGDELLTQIGPRLSAVLRNVDSIARLGGDE